MSDDRFTKEQAEIDHKAKAQPVPTSRVEPCRRYVEQPAVSAEEIERFARRFAKKEKK